MFKNLRYYAPELQSPFEQTLITDVCIYGGISAGVVAALQIARMGKRCVILEPSAHLGGLSAGGLGYTDFGRKYVVGGISREFYQRLGKHYGLPAEWCFEPHVAEALFEEMAAESEAQVFKQQFLAKVLMDGQRISEIIMHSGLRVRAKMFIDCTYEGDLMAKAGVRYHVGRESNATYGETLNGVQMSLHHTFAEPVSPYIVENDPSSGLLPGINPTVAAVGSGDKRVQAYNFRLCLTQEKANRLPYPKPAGYNPLDYILAARNLRAAGWRDSQFNDIQGNKFDKNNSGGCSTDYIGGNHAYPDADYATRERIFQDHVRYVMGFMYFIANDPGMTNEVREWWNQWSLCKDEFVSTGGWPHALYVREARRMIGDTVLTEADCTGRRQAAEVIGLGSYDMDSHNCQRVVVEGYVKNEGDVEVGLHAPYFIGYRHIVPACGQCENLLVPVCLSASHIAYGSVRMEPVFMLLGQSAAAAAVAAIEGKTRVQDVDYGELRKVLLAAGQILERDAEEDRKAYHGNA